jgi:hypothetical protein
LTGSLKRKILLTNLVVLSLMVGASHLMTYMHWRSHLLSFAQSQGWAMSSIIRQRLYREFMDGDIEGIRDLLKAMLDHQAVHAARVTNEKGLVLLSAVPEEEHRMTVKIPRDVSERLQWTSAPKRLTRATADLTFFVPIPRGPECRECHYPTAPQLAVLQLDVGADRLTGILRGSIYQVMIITSVTVGLLLLALHVLLQREVNQPVSRILGVMEMARDGDLRVRVPAGGSDEMGRIGEGLNRMLEQLHSAREELQTMHHQEMGRQERLATIGNLASAVAHEIKNPLAGIRGGMEVLEDGLLAGDPKRDLTREIKAEVDRINRMVRDLLSYSRQPNPETVPALVGDLIEDVITQARQLPDAARVEIRHTARCGCRVAVDYQLIKQAFFNIIQNAFDAMPQGGTLTVACDEIAGAALIRFADTGGGIAPEAAARIMQPFFTTRHRGTGLGLPIALSIVEAHGGEITFWAEPGLGTTFTVRLPLLEQKENAAS